MTGFSPTNNSSLSDKLKLGFSTEARPAASHNPGLLPHEVKREAEPYLRPTLASAPSLVTASSHSGEQCVHYYLVCTMDVLYCTLLVLFLCFGPLNVLKVFKVF